ncbi:NADH-quinone oxidoreductase subunit NuoN [Niveibacterium sp. 24ML]|uniref:NADH-quinone oxidoreductase subunit NuoN n=1 Tax=Niveibacterium sp. 24ML TaxID=2985512 RepID=UPI002270176B|nr:NADH-quinone oxidoreductase subunit NuoN [Niveibacterium sp. 24ML]MCX9155193.1 NADH-quinone oxidoreductase subunit NuoN [Niveibacterium sp. 24ML]
MDFVMPDFRLAAPELFVAAMSLVILMVTSFAKSRARSAAFWLCEFTLLAAVFLTLFSGTVDRAQTFSGMYISDLLGGFLKAVVCLSVAVVLQYGRAYMADRKIDSPEYYILVLFAALGMMVLISASHFVSIYLGLELMSLALYALVAIDRDNPRSTEAGMKYFVLGALASGLLLYGMSMLYGATGSLQIHEISQRIYERSANDMVVVFGLVFVLVGIAFKLGVVPFHMWVPDVYHGAPTAVTLLVSSAPKIAAFAMAFRILVLGLFDLAEQWQMMLMLLAVGSIVLGNLAAVAQTNIKRMLAYSGISHMGFMLLGLMSGVVKGEGGTYAVNAYSSAMFYAVAYVMMTLAAFGMVILLSRAGFEAENVDDFKGLNQRSPWFAGMMLIVMFSMAGIPFFVGFFAKLSVLQAVVAAGNVSGQALYYWLAGLAVLMSAVGAYYYLRVVKVMYFDDAVDTSPLTATLGTRTLLSANALSIAAVGLLPNWLMQICAFTLLH